MKIAIVGASGFIGSAITKLLLDTTTHQLVLFSHRASMLEFTTAAEKRITHVDGSVLHYDDIHAALEGCDAAIYLVHLMGQGSDYLQSERQAAHNFGKAVGAQAVRRVVYVGGMGEADAGRPLTTHLQSRQRTGHILASYAPEFVELRTPMVIGQGGAGFEVLKRIVALSPIMPLPRWARGTTQPITVQDVARYAVASLQLQCKEVLSIAIGGPESLSYGQIAQRYASSRDRTLYVIAIPLLPRWLAIRVLKLFAGGAAATTVADMIESAGYSTVASNNALDRFPEIVPEVIERAF